MRIGLILIVATLSLGAASAPDGGGVVPTERCGDYFVVRLTVDGDAPRELSFLLDTGSPATLVHPTALRGIVPDRVRSGERIVLRNAVAGPLRFDELIATVRELDHLRFTVGRPVDGVLGWPSLRGVLLTVDYPAGEIRVGDGRLPAVDEEEVFRLRGTDMPLLAVQFDPIAVSMLLDTGSVSPLVVRNGHDLGDWESLPLPIGTWVGTRRVERFEAGRLAGEVPFGPSSLAQPIVHLTDGQSRVGAGVLRHFVLTFDPGGRAVRIERDGRKPVRFDPVRSTGAILGPRRGGFQVIGVLEGTPAAEAGLEVGDAVIAVDGLRTDSGECFLPSKPPRRKRVYTLEREEGVEDVRLPLIELVP